jgi:hypothetical protein
MYLYNNKTSCITAGNLKNNHKSSSSVVSGSESELAIENSTEDTLWRVQRDCVDV